MAYLIDGYRSPFVLLLLGDSLHDIQLDLHDIDAMDERMTEAFVNLPMSC